MAKKLSKVFVLLMVMLIGLSVAACTDGGGDTPPAGDTITVQGTASSSVSTVSGVTVKIGDIIKTTGTDGSYKFEGLEKKDYSVEFSKTGFQTVTKDAKVENAIDGVITVNATMSAVVIDETVTVKGKVTDADGNAIGGVQISASGLTAVTTAEDGTYSFANIEAGTYIFNYFKSGYKKVAVTVTSADFATDKELVKDIILQIERPLPGMTKAELQAAYGSMKEVSKGYLNAAKDVSTRVETGWATKKVAATTSFTQHSEGYEINSEDNSGEEFQIYMYGKTTVTADTAQLTLYARTFGTETEYALRVINVTDDYEAAFVPAKNSSDDWDSVNSDICKRIDYDLSAYTDKNVVIAFGVRKARICIESTEFMAKDESYVFARTTQGQLATLDTWDFETATAFAGCNDGNNPTIKDSFLTVGAGAPENKDKRWFLRDARGTADEEEAPYTYVLGKFAITRATAKLTIEEYHYNNKNDGKFAKSKAFFYDATTKQLLASFADGAEDRPEKHVMTFNLDALIGKTVYAAIGSSNANSMGIREIKFERLNYEVKGTVTVPNGFSLNDVSVKLGEKDITSCLNKTTGAYSVIVAADETGLITFSSSANLLDSIIDLSKITVEDSVTKNITMTEPYSGAVSVMVTVMVNEQEVKSDITVKIGDQSAALESGTWQYGGFTQLEAIGKTITITPVAEGEYDGIHSETTYVILASDFDDGAVPKAQITIELKAVKFLNGKNIYELEESKELKVNDYHARDAATVEYAWERRDGGRFDWHQGEGSTLRIIEDDNIAVSTDNFNTYIYGRKTITANSSQIVINMRTHGNSENAPTVFGVQVFDFATLTLAKVGENKSVNQGTGDYADFSFDLSAYIGKEVLVIVGNYRTLAAPAEGADYNGWREPQFVINSIIFKSNREGSTGEVIPTKTYLELADSVVYTDEDLTFLGQNGDRNKSNHIISTWGTIATDGARLERANEGYLMKTAGSTSNKDKADKMFYAQITISANNAFLTMPIRTFSTNATNFGLTVVYKDSKDSDTIKSVVVAAGGDATGTETDKWSFIKDKNDNYATATWDLSDYIGETVVIVIGVRNKTTTGEHKLAIKELVFSAVPTTPAT